MHLLTTCGMVLFAVFTIPSHIYKYSESELALYLKNHKNAWRDLSKVLDRRIDISDEEIILVFPASRFPDIARIIPLVHKKGRAEGSLTPQEMERARLNLVKKSPNKIDQKERKSIENGQGRAITLDAFGGS